MRGGGKQSENSRFLFLFFFLRNASNRSLIPFHDFRRFAYNTIRPGPGITHIATPPRHRQNENRPEHGVAVVAAFRRRKRPTELGERGEIPKHDGFAATFAATGTPRRALGQRVVEAGYRDKGRNLFVPLADGQSGGGGRVSRRQTESN